uniref:Uncharacterized protein n=1 Tax=Arundo donax TaxID=35708 RepID=A0A0A8YME0_ARUDO
MVLHRSNNDKLILECTEEHDRSLKRVLLFNQL